MALVVKNLLANAGDVETPVPSLGQKEPLEEGTTTHSSILAWKIPWTESLMGYSSQDCKEMDITEQLTMHTQKRERKKKDGPTKP